MVQLILCSLDFQSLPLALPECSLPFFFNLLHRSSFASVELVLAWGVSNHWNGIWNGTMEWKMEWNGEHTQLQLTRVTGTAQSGLNCLVYL